MAISLVPSIPLFSYKRTTSDCFFVCVLLNNRKIEDVLGNFSLPFKIEI